MISRRKSLQSIASGLCAAFGASMFSGGTQAASTFSGGPRRVIFYLSQGGTLKYAQWEAFQASVRELLPGKISCG